MQHKFVVSKADFDRLDRNWAEWMKEQSKKEDFTDAAIIELGDTKIYSMTVRSTALLGWIRDNYKLKQDYNYLGDGLVMTSEMFLAIQMKFK